MKFKVLHPIVFDGQPRDPGDTVEATAEQAQRALVKGYLEEANQPKGKAKRS